MKSEFRLNQQQQKEEAIINKKTDDRLLKALLNSSKTTARMSFSSSSSPSGGRKEKEPPLHFGKVILEDGREFLQQEEEEEQGGDNNKNNNNNKGGGGGMVIYRRKAPPTSYGRHQQRLQQKRQRKVLQEINLQGGTGGSKQAAIVQQNLNNGSQSAFIQHHHHQLQPKSHQKEHQQFYVAKSLLGQPQKQFQERVQRRQVALFLYRQWQLQVRREFEDLEKIHRNTMSSVVLRATTTLKGNKGGNMVARPIQLGLGFVQKIIRRRPSPIMRKERTKKKGEVKTSELRKFLNLLETSDIVSSFLDRDSCYRLSDKYLLAATFVYFKRAGLPLDEYTPWNFFVSLYLANDMEEDEEDLKYEIFPWALGVEWLNRFQEFLKDRDHLFQEIGQRGVVSRVCCEEVMAIIPNSKFWLRNRLLHHAGGVRNTTIFINSTPDDDDHPPSSSNNDNTTNTTRVTTTNNPPKIKDNESGGVPHFNYCGIVEPVQRYILSPDIAPVPCFLCHPELAPTPPKNCPLLSVVLQENPSIQGQTQQWDLEKTKVVTCFTSSSSSDSSDSSDSHEDNDDDDDDDDDDGDEEGLSFSDTSSSILS